MPIVGCAAFTWDGIYIGATASRSMRNSMLWATLTFVLVWAAGKAALGFMHEGDPGSYGIAAVHVLMAAYFSHLLARTIYLSIKYKKVVLSTPFV
jgi:MATE family multidrug resistance protein